MRLTFLLLSPTFGMHQYTADLANRMTRSFEVHVVTTQSHPKDRYGPEVKVHAPVNLGNTGLSLGSIRLDQLRRVKRSLESVGPDLVHITGPHLWNVPLVNWLRKKGIPVVHTIHDLDPHHGVSYGQLLHLWNWAIIRRADQIVVHGAAYRQRLIASGRDPERVTCTPLTHLFVGYGTEKELEKDGVEVRYEPLVLFFGRQERYKGVDILVNAFRRLGDRLDKAAPGQPARLVLAGPGKMYEDQYDDGNSDIEWRSHLIGDQEGVALFSRCAMVVLPYRDATQSAVVAAAYYFRKPVIVTDVGALAEYVEPGKTGLVVEDVNAVDELAEAMLRLLLKPGYKETMGSAGRAWYDEQRARETGCLEELYRGLIG